MATILQKLAASTVVGLLAFLQTASPLEAPTTAISNVVPQEEVQEETPLEKWLGLLSVCESNNREGIRILDTNNEYSYGLLQFQEQTFTSFSVAYNLFPNTELQELHNLLYDGYSQKVLAREMILRDYDNWKHWKNCVKKIGLPPRS